MPVLWTWRLYLAGPTEGPPSSGRARAPGEGEGRPGRVLDTHLGDLRRVLPGVSAAMQSRSVRG